MATADIRVIQVAHNVAPELYTILAMWTRDLTMTRKKVTRMMRRTSLIMGRTKKAY